MGALSVPCNCVSHSGVPGREQYEVPGVASLSCATALPGASGGRGASLGISGVFCIAGFSLLLGVGGPGSSTPAARLYVRRIAGDIAEHLAMGGGQWESAVAWNQRRSRNWQFLTAPLHRRPWVPGPVGDCTPYGSAVLLRRITDRFFGTGSSASAPIRGVACIGSLPALSAVRVLESLLSAADGASAELVASTRSISRQPVASGGGPLLGISGVPCAGGSSSLLAVGGPGSPVPATDSAHRRRWATLRDIPDRRASGVGLPSLGIRASAASAIQCGSLGSNPTGPLPPEWTAGQR